MANSFPSDDPAAAAIPVRLLSSVAVVGRDNEPIYLRGDLCDCCSNTTTTSTAGAGAGVGAVHNASGGGTSSVITNDEEEEENAEGGDDISPNEDDGGGESETSPSNNNRNSNNKGLFGRIKGVVGRNNNNNIAADEEGDAGAANDEKEEEDDEDDDDPFGFFENNNNAQSSSSSSNTTNNIPPTMTLTQQLVLHASLDRFEEMASRSNRGGTVRWRTPGSGNAANAMWMGLLCRVEERWNVYGYLTNTGIKFMILVENIYLNRDGTRFRQDHAPPSLSSTMFGSTTAAATAAMSSSSLLVGSREADLKKMFAQLHELYVRYTLNPFSQLRSPIQSRVFDDGIVRMAQSFNGAALDQISSSSLLDGSYLGGGGSGSGALDKKKNNGLVWM